MNASEKKVEPENKKRIHREYDVCSRASHARVCGSNRAPYMRTIFLSSDEDDEGFDLIQPSLIQQLRTILDQYPDDGQILKVIVDFPIRFQHFTNPRSAIASKLVRNII